MKKAKTDIEGAKLRQKAEELLKRNQEKNANPISESEVLKLVHELGVHQIELELQNEELIEAKQTAQIATEKYVELYDFALFGFFTLSKEGEILALNFNGAKMLGKNRSELLDRRFVLFTSDDSKPIFNSFCEKISSSKATESCEVEILNNSSSPTYVHLSGIISEDENQFFVMALDITSRKHTEIEIKKAKEKAEESELQFRNAFNSAGIGMCLVSLDGKFLKLNNSALSIWGYKESEILNMTFQQITHPEDLDKDLELLNKTIEGKISNYSIVKRYYNKKSEIIFANLTVSIVRNLKNEPQFFVSQIENITKQIIVEQELIKSKEKAEEKASELKKQQKLFETMFNTINEGVVITNTNREIILANKGMYTTFGYNQNEIIGKQTKILYTDTDKFKETGNNVFNKEAAKNDKEYLTYYKDKNNKVFPGETFGTKLYDDQGEWIGNIGIMRNVSEREGFIKELTIAKEKAEENEEKFKLLNRLTSEMLLLQDMESIYKFIAENLQKLHPNTIVLNVSIDESSQQTRLEVISDLDNSLLTKVIKISGFNPIGKTYKLTDIHNNYFRSGDFIEFDGGLAEFSASEFPAVAAKAIEKLIGLHKIYTIGINKDDGLLAAIHFFTFNKQVISDGNFIEVFVKQAGLVLQKKNDEKALKIAKEKAEESEQRLKLATSSGELGIWDWNLNENSMIWNERMFELYGIEQNNFPKNIDAWVTGLHPEDKDRAISESNEALAGGKQFDTTFRVLHPNGTVKYLKADAVVIRDNSEKAIRMIGINKDVTESILAEQSLKTSETQLKELNATKDKLFSIIAHDLRSPFNNILGYSELLSENVKEFSIEESKRYSDIIKSVARNTLNLLDNLLNWAKSQTGSLGIAPEKITLSKVILEVIELKKLLARSKNITLNYTPSDEFEVYSDENMLRLVIRNLISNAIKFTKSGGKINVSVISVQNHVEISVSDNGVGMSDETCKKLFDISTNTTSPGTANEKGSGLGLVLCKEFVEKLGGKIWVESEEGIGSRFYFTIPYGTSNNEIDEKDSEKLDNQLSVKKKLKMLVAEDDETAITYLSIILKEYAKEMLVAKTGIEAVEICRDNPDIDLVLMDIKMPGIDGYKATRQIRKFNKEVFIMAQTAYAQTGDHEKAIEAGCDEYISKPINKEKLLEIIANHF